MAELPKVRYAGKIKEVKIGKPGTELTLGGSTGYSFYSFEGRMPNCPKLALQVLDIEPEEWASEALEPFKDVIGDPVKWAKKSVHEYKADCVALWLAGTDPNGHNLSAEHAAAVAKEVALSIDVPLIVWGTSNDEKNTEVLKAVAEACDGLNLVIGPVTEHNYKQVGAAAIAYKHVVAANSPIDINLAKQLNILLENLGVPQDKILIDPTTGSVGYGMEYCYSIMERIRQAALTQNDEKLQYPLINNIAEEVWKIKEAKLATSEEPKLGQASIRAINLEAITAISAMQAGSDLLILRHPRTLAAAKKYLSDIMIQTDLEEMGLDMSLAAPAAPPAKQAPAAKAQPKAQAPEKRQPPAKIDDAKAKSAQAIAEAVSAPPAAEAKEEPKRVVKTVPPAQEVAMKPGEELVQLELSEEEVETLREMLAAFRGLKNFFSGLSRLLEGK